MTSKKWLITLAVTVLALLVGLGLWNALLDPFGVFGDRLLNWTSYDVTNNPRAAKAAYLREHWQEYDAYVVGSSTASAYSTELLGEYLDADFYNLFIYGCDFKDLMALSRYVVEEDAPRYLLLNLGLKEAAQYDLPKEDVTQYLDAEAEGSSRLLYWLRYLFANPRYGANKLWALGADTYLPQTFDVFEEDTGRYDKSARAIEPIGALAPYLEENPSFLQYQASPMTLWHMDSCIAELTALRDLCRRQGTELILVFAPVYQAELASFDQEQIADYFRKLASVSDFWDFSFSSASSEPRYFYDENHIRNELGDMMLTRMFGSPQERYMPEDFGVLVTQETVEQRIAALPAAAETPVERETDLPVLMYHHIKQPGEKTSGVSLSRFQEQIEAVEAAGYQTVSLTQVVDYVERGIDLPDHPLLITFDDGYLSNYQLAYPILKEHGMKAVMFAIGMSMGKETYKETDIPIVPHFSGEQAREMVDSGVVEVQSHSYAMHESVEYEPEETYRSGMLQREGEPEQDYLQALRQDARQERALLEEVTGAPPIACAYPGGHHTELAAAVLREEGIKLTFTILGGNNTILKGLPQSLYELNRYTVTDDTTGEDLLAILAGK